MTYILLLFTFLPDWFVGPLPLLDLPPGVPPVYYSGGNRPLEAATGPDRIVIVVDPRAPVLGTGHGPIP